MYKWKVKYILKNGDHLIGYYHGPESKSDGVARRLLQGDLNTFNGLNGSDDKSNLLIRNECVAAIDISAT